MNGKSETFQNNYLCFFVRHESKEFCEADDVLRRQLATIRSLGEQDVVKELLERDENTNTIENSTRILGFWIGLTRDRYRWNVGGIDPEEREFTAVSFFCYTPCYLPAPFYLPF